MTAALAPGAGAWLVMTTCPDEETAHGIARTLVEERLAACGNVVPGVTSIYRWQGEIETAAECVVLFKTQAERLEALAHRLEELHPYEVPEFLAFPVERGLPAYLAWVAAETEEGAAVEAPAEASIVAAVEEDPAGT
ncbi:MAG TPA: divalent-cation tolerance protein CutA [Gemmatimonadota bacterium]|nr:divalent-cation tolerance protein CutA [Gemmatimonadota bacterium]